jgi:hypothetical protein
MEEIQEAGEKGDKQLNRLLLLGISYRRNRREQKGYLNTKRTKFPPEGSKLE